MLERVLQTTCSAAEAWTSRSAEDLHFVENRGRVFVYLDTERCHPFSIPGIDDNKWPSGSTVPPEVLVPRAFSYPSETLGFSLPPRVQSDSDTDSGPVRKTNTYHGLCRVKLSVRKGIPGGTHKKKSGD